MTFSPKKAFAAVALGVASLAASASPTFIKWTCLSAGVGVDQDTTQCAEDGLADGIMYHDDNLGVDIFAKRYLEGPVTLAAANGVSTANIDGITGWRASNSYAALDNNNNQLTDMFQLLSAYNSFAGGNPMDYLAIATDAPHWATQTGLTLDASSFEYASDASGSAYAWAFHEVARQNNAPEPGSLALLVAAGAAGLYGRRRAKGLDM